MQGARRLISSRKGLLLALIALTLLVRAAVPSGWMPVASDGVIRITLCSGAGPVAAWIGKDGNIHKEDPSSNDQQDSPCAFTGLGLLAALPEGPLAQTLALIEASRNGHAFPSAISVGQGLAAPPPPKTGPPALI